MPGLTFTAPEHYSSALQQSPESASTPFEDAYPVPSRDPHALPEFTSTSFIHPAAPTLYLPPLISSLPASLPPAPLPEEYPPLVTETRLPDIDPTSLSLHKALHYFRPYTDQYAHQPYEQAFNWDCLHLPLEEEREWYCVAFRSKRKNGSDSGPLYDADKLAHEEAVRNGGLIMYWYGVPDPSTGLNLATCIWQSRRHARAANSHPHHIRAMKLAAVSYELYTLERYVLRKVKGELGVKVETYAGDKEVGW